jgi:hypothetical protein
MAQGYNEERDQQAAVGEAKEVRGGYANSASHNWDFTYSSNVTLSQMSFKAMSLKTHLHTLALCMVLIDMPRR